MTDQNTKLLDFQKDPKAADDIAAHGPDCVRRMYEGYVLGDAGGPLPEYG